MTEQIIKHQKPHIAKHVLGDCASSEVYLMDCIYGMKNYPDKYFDLACIDPPYGIGMDGGNVGYKGFNNFEKKNWDLSIPEMLFFTEIFRVSKNQIIWGGNYFIPFLPATRCFLVWDKGEGFYNRTYAECELAWTSFKNGAKIYNKIATQLNRIHPTQKPINLYRWILKNYAKEGDKILDTHGGSMNIATACEKKGFDLDICEIDTDYFNAGIKKYEQNKQQLTIF